MGKTVSSGPVLLGAKDGSMTARQSVIRFMVLIEDKLDQVLGQDSVVCNQNGFCRIQFCCDAESRNGLISRRLVQADVLLDTAEVWIEHSAIVLDQETELLADPASVLVWSKYYVVDPKGRITIPESFRCQYSGPEFSVVMTFGPCNTVLILETSVWNQWYDARKNDPYFQKRYLNKAQVSKKVHARTRRVLVSDLIRKYAHIKPGMEIIALKLRGHPGVMVCMPTTHYLEIEESGVLSLVAQRLLFDLNRPKIEETS